MSKAIKTLRHIGRKLTPYLIMGGIIFLCVQIVEANNNYLGPEWNKYLNDLPGFADNNKTGEDLAIDFVKNLVRIVRYLIGGVALLVALFYGIKMVTARGKEDEIQKIRTNLTWLVVGFIVLILAENVAKLLSPETATTQAIIDFNAAEDQLRSIVNYFKYLFSFIMLLLMIASGIQLMTTQGEEDKINQQKRNLLYTGIGMLVIMLADNVVDAVYVIKAPGQYEVGNSTIAIAEIAGVIRLILAFLGPIVVAMTIVAGFYYLTAMEKEDQAKKARSIIVAGVTGIIMIYAASAIVNTVIARQLAPG